jgi:hypothetical protein
MHYQLASRVGVGRYQQSHYLFQKKGPAYSVYSYFHFSPAIGPPHSPCLPLSALSNSIVTHVAVSRSHVPTRTGNDVNRPSANLTNTDRRHPVDHPQLRTAQLAAPFLAKPYHTQTLQIRAKTSFAKACEACKGWAEECEVAPCIRQ